MASQPNEKTPDVPDALIKELLRREGLPPDAHVKVNVHTTRVRVNPDGTRTVLADSSPARGRSRSKRPPRKWVGVLFSFIGFVQMAYGMWAAHSDSLTAPLVHGNESCQIARLAPRDPSDLATVSLAGSPSAPAACHIEPAVVVRRYASSSHNVMHYHVVTVTPTGTHDDVPVVGRAGMQLWNRVQPTERIAVQRFVVPGYHRTGDVIAMGDSLGATLSRWHPDAPNQNNLVNILMGGVLFVTGMALFVKARAAEGA